MLLSLACCLLLFPFAVFGLAWPIARKLALDPPEKILATVTLSLIGVYLLGFGVYATGLPWISAWLVPLLGAAGLVIGRDAVAAVLADLDVRATLAVYLAVTAWCLSCLAVVTSYSGGGWTGDWFEHWERTRFFVERWPEHAKFLGTYTLSARPPLANVATGTLLAPIGLSFAGYQLVLLLLNTLVVIPAALLVRRFARDANEPKVSLTFSTACIPLLGVFLMLNPSFVENSTFAWTKLAAAFFVLGGVYFFLRAQDDDAPPAAGILCSLSLAAGIVTHYSAAPYALLLAIAWLAIRRHSLTPAFLRQTTAMGVVGAAMLATWFAWSFCTYGARETLFSNSSVIAADASGANQLVKIALNIRDTVIPHFLRSLDRDFIAQRSPWGYGRDWLFQVYQVNLFFIFGSTAWIALIRELFRVGRAADRASTAFWVGFIAGAIFLGIAVHGARDTWGLAHICLQPLMLLGLVFLAARWSRLELRWRTMLVCGLAVDFCLGIFLNFAVQGFWFERWFSTGPLTVEQLTHYTTYALMNMEGKLVHHLVFLSDAVPAWAALVLALSAAILTLALLRAAGARRSSA